MNTKISNVSLANSDAPPQSQNALMDLRIVNLRTIADVWSDDKFKGKAGLNAWERLYAQNLISKDQLKQLNNSDLPVRKTLRLTLSGTAKKPGLNAGQLKIYFKIRYQYHSPFPQFGTQFIPGTAIWDQYGLQSWTKPEDETITVTLPQAYRDWNEVDKTERLMEYYNYFPTFFGSSENSKHQQPPSPGKAMALSSLAVGGTVDLTGNNYDLGVSQDNFLGFGAVVIKIIASAWANKQFMDEIDYDKKHKNTSDANYYRRISIILQEQFQFTNPWAFNIKFEFSKSFWRKNSKGQRVWNTPKKDLIRNYVTLEVPQSPIKDEENMSYALAKYNSIGPAYPFTCS